MTANSANAADLVRRTLLKIDADELLAVVDALDLRGSGKISAVIGVPLRNLQQRRDVSAFVASAPLSAQRALLEILALAPLEKVVASLADDADNPTFEQLDAAINRVREEGMSDNEIVAVLGFAVSEGFAAAPHCLKILNERPEFELPPLPDATTSANSLLTPKQVDPAVKEQRRARREAERQRKKGPTPSKPVRPAKSRATDATNIDPSVKDAVTPTPEITPVRRRSILTPAEMERFDTEHPFVGLVVVADVPFDAVDPQIPELKSKERPAVIVGIGVDAVLVRAVYSSPSPTRVTFQPWRRLNFDHMSYIDGLRTIIEVTDSGSLPRLGRLSVQEWNALI